MTCHEETTVLENNVDYDNRVLKLTNENMNRHASLLERVLLPNSLSLQECLSFRRQDTGTYERRSPFVRVDIE